MGTSGLCLTALIAGLLTGLPSGTASGGTDPPRPLRLAAERGGVSALDVPLGRELGPAGGGRYRSSRMSTGAFSMVGFTWPSSGPDVRLRVRVRADGGWGAWQQAEPMSHNPDARSSEGGSRAGSELLWVGRSNAVQVESGRRPPAGLSMTLIQPGRDPARASARTPAAKPQKPRRAPRPEYRGRKAWGADERLRDGSPRYNRTIQQVHVHHTVNSNKYDRSDVAGLIRGMYRYHTQSLGWSDIGYNFLVDRFGRTWVGRAGGARRAVRGAHTLGFNSTSTGVAVIGNYETAWPWKKVRTAIVQLAAWKLDKYDRDPGGTVRVYSHGSDRFPAGRTVRLPTIDGHRDTNETACPGRHLYAKLPNIRRRAAERADRFG